MRVGEPLMLNKVAAQRVAQSRRGRPRHDSGIPVGEGLEREHHAAGTGKNHPGNIHDGEGRLRAHRTGNEQTQRRKRAGTHEHRDDGARDGDSVRAPAQTVPERRHQRELNRHDHQHRNALAHDQAVTAQGSGRQESQHAVAAIKTGGNALTG